MRWHQKLGFFSYFLKLRLIKAYLIIDIILIKYSNNKLTKVNIFLKKYWKYINSIKNKLPKHLKETKGHQSHSSL